MCDRGELGNGKEGGCGAVVQGGGLLEVPACVYGGSLELHCGSVLLGMELSCVGEIAI